mmetsp:Transcript_23048/g.36709  ORF Transcript_23048/g.36709 Transcript_23048/m.36709 type:complete len:83 (+) Transcript_23048:794-1042(+)
MGQLGVESSKERPVNMHNCERKRNSSYRDLLVVPTVTCSHLRKQLESEGSLLQARNNLSLANPSRNAGIPSSACWWSSDQMV